MRRPLRFVTILVVVFGLATCALAADTYYWTNASGDGMWNRTTAPYNWEKVPAWNPDGPRTPCPPPEHSSANIWISGNPRTLTKSLVIPAGYDADCTYGDEYGTIFGPEWGLHLDIYGGLTYKWYIVLAQGLPGLTDPTRPDDDPNRSVLNMYSGSRIHGTKDSVAEDKTRAEGIAIGTNWWDPLPYVTMNMYEGSECLVVWAWIGGHLNMYGGTFDVLTGVNMGIGTPANVPDNLIRVNIEKGRLILPRDFDDEVQDWIARGILKAYGTTPGLPRGSQIVIDMTSVPGRTIITALAVVPPQASQPDPADGAEDVRINPVLRWLAGIDASEHRVYFGINAGDVNDANEVDHANVTFADASDNSLDPGLLEPGTSYYWRVDEVNDAHADKLWKGDVWTFTTGNYRVIDDFESYTNDSPDRVFQTWLDGMGYSEDEFFPVAYPGNGTGAAIGHDIWSPDSPDYQRTIMERTLVRSGHQSMPFYYDNSGTTRLSETTRAWTQAQDWTVAGADTLVLYVLGQADNTADDLYVKVTDRLGHSVAVQSSDLSLLTGAEWNAWRVAFSQFTGVDMVQVTSLAIGLGNTASPKHGKGMILIDDVLVEKSGQ
ncbi:MAG: hypothetical protein JW955_10265 [Sedimentisphaerales bacterium]|nr:hypothetical protein [Sedimentisphaerales bacterium]